MTVNPIPAGYNTITPYLVVKGVPQLIKFLQQAFDAEVKYCLKDDKGTVRHAQLKIGTSMMMMGEAPENYTIKPGMVYMYVPDADATYKKALAAGAKSVMEPRDAFYGDRSGGVEDASGNQWWMATHIEDVTEEEIKRRMAQMGDSCKNAS